MSSDEDAGALVADLQPRPEGRDSRTASVAVARRAQHAQFAALVAEHDDRLRTLTYQLLGTREAMDDVLQDVYIKAYRGMSTFRGDAALSTWLYRITYTTCMDRLRRGARAEAVRRDLTESCGAEGTAPDDSLALGEELRCALSCLDAEHRAAVLLVLRDGHSYDGAASILGVPRGTVASRVARARRQLARSLSASLEGDRL
jgi:RNA polymerase sigma-70 factor (ECF subfamily)